MRQQKEPAGEQARAVYDRLAGNYDCALAPLERLFLRDLRRRAFGHLPKPVRLLEVGAGTGANFEFYPRASISVASELSREMLRRARAKTEKAASPVRLVRADAEALPFADASFDAACATLVFCSIRSPSRAFAELRRVVKPGGAIVLLEHVRPNKRLLGKLFDALNMITVPLFDDHFNRQTARLAQRAGLEVRGVENFLRGVVQIISCRAPLR